MLFLTVYGPELESLFRYIHTHTQLKGAVSREQVYSVYLPRTAFSQKGHTKNIEDALQYLKATRLIEGDQAYISTLDDVDIPMPFGALLLYHFRQLERLSSKLPLLDLLYITLLERLYIAPNRLWISDLHAEANRLELAQQIGGVSQEKIGAWKRVMEFLGLGYRMGAGFYCLFRPELVDAIVRRWTLTEGTLQELVEGHLQLWLPCLTARNEIALAVAHTLEQLEHDGKIHLLPQQDSSSRPYFGTRRLRGIHVV